MMFGGPPRDLDAEHTKVLDEALETLRWARQHLREPGASEALRELQGKVGYLAQSISWRSDGSESEAEVALGVAQGQSFKDQERVRQMWEELFWSH
jgi:hypothetical protein